MTTITTSPNRWIADRHGIFVKNKYAPSGWSVPGDRFYRVYRADREPQQRWKDGGTPSHTILAVTRTRKERSRVSSCVAAFSERETDLATILTRAGAKDARAIATPTAATVRAVAGAPSSRPAVATRYLTWVAENAMDSESRQLAAELTAR